MVIVAADREQRDDYVVGCVEVERRAPGRLDFSLSPDLLELGGAANSWLLRWSLLVMGGLNSIGW